MVLPSSGPISFSDIATEYEIGTGSPVSFDRIKTISTNWSGTSIGMNQLYSLDRDDLVGKSTPDMSVTGSGASFSIFPSNRIITFRVAVGLSATVDGNIVNTGNVLTQGVAIYTWNGTLYARAGDGDVSNSGDGEVSFTIPSGWTTSQIRVVVVTFCLNASESYDKLGTNLLVVDGILRDQSTATATGRVSGNTDGKTGQVNTPGYGVYTRMSNNDLSYEAPSAIISAQVWYDRLGYIPGYIDAVGLLGSYYIYENSNAYIVFSRVSTRTFGLYDIGPNTRPAVRYLIVGSGGGGGQRNDGGGGGGGGILFDDTGVTLASGTYTVVIGSGGTRGNPGTNGSNATFHTYTALGGGGGGGDASDGRNGGTGGGGGANAGPGDTGVGGTGSQGGDGGDATVYSGTGYGGGGGGGGASGQDGTDGKSASLLTGYGWGGNGTQYSWGHLGETATYYGGGGTGRNSDATGGGLGGGGGPGQANGLAVYGGGAREGGNGGSGAVIIRLPWTIPTS